MKKLLTSLLTSFYLLSPLNSQDSIKFSSDKWILPDFEITYVRDENQSNLEGKLDDIISFEYTENKYPSGDIHIYERFNDLYTNYHFQRGNPSVKINFENDRGETGFIKEDTSATTVNTTIDKFLDGKNGEGKYRIMAGEEFYDIIVNKVEDTDSSVVFHVPLGYQPLNIEQAVVHFKKDSGKLVPDKIFIDFPWYLSFLDYKLEKNK